MSLMVEYDVSEQECQDESESIVMEEKWWRLDRIITELLADHRHAKLC